MFEDRTERLRSVTTIVDVGLTLITFLLAYDLREIVWGIDDASFISHVALVPLIVALWEFFLAYFGAYRSPRLASLFDFGWAVLRGVGAGLVVLLTLLFLLKIQYVSRAVIVSFAVMNVVALVASRVVLVNYFRRSLKRGENFLKVLIIGTGQRAARLSQKLRENSEWGLGIVGHLDPDPSRTGQIIEGAPVLGTIDDITAVLKGHVVDEVILAIPRAMIPDMERIARSCEEEGVKLRLMADVFDVHVARMRLVELGDLPLLTLEPVALNESKLLLKRIIDLLACVAAMPVLVPLFAVVGIAVRLDSPGPVFFIQERVGLNKRRFRLYKFRTMVEGSEKMMAQIEHLNEAQGPIFKIANDPRITRIGRFLRRSSLDEFPQFLNVLKGEMSLVGPRPMSVRDVDLFDKGIQRKRFSVKPGLVCLREVSGRSQLSFSKWLELDLQYIENWSLGLDIKILLKTVPVVLKGTGAV